MNIQLIVAAVLLAVFASLYGALRIEQTRLATSQAEVSRLKGVDADLKVCRIDRDTALAEKKTALDGLAEQNAAMDKLKQAATEAMRKVAQAVADAKLSRRQNEDRAAAIQNAKPADSDDCKAADKLNYEFYFGKQS